VRPDMRIVVTDDFDRLADRLNGTLRIMREIAKIAGRKGQGGLLGCVVFRDVATTLPLTAT